MAFADSVSRLDGACLAIFGRGVTYTPRPGVGGGPLQITGILEPATQTEERFPDSYARLFVRSSDLSFVPGGGDKVTIDGVVYMVVDARADTAGGVMLELRETT